MTAKKQTTVASNNVEFKSGYLLWSPEAYQAPKLTFESRPEAIRVAHIMANKNPAQTFYVCKIVGVAATRKVEYTDIDE
jgi:hypothetical protein